MNEVIYYLAMALFVIGAISYGVIVSRVIKNKVRINFNELTKKYLPILGGCFGLLTIGLILFTSAFYLDPSTLGLIKNKYIGRSFILSEQKERENIVNLKLNAIRAEIEGKRIVVIDDSLVRGTTCKYLIRLLRRAGAKEIHLRISSPQVLFPCYLGIDTPQKEELISTRYSVSEICRQVGADSLAFITLPGMVEVLNSFADNGGFCTGCFNGEYPVPAIHS